MPDEYSSLPNAQRDLRAGRPEAAMAELPAAVLDAVTNFDDFDIQILYEILQVAQSDPTYTTKPYQAIYPAHEAVLDQHGVSRASPDSPYLRFAYRLPGLRKGGEGLVDVFERVLTQVGIAIESASEGSGDDRTRLSEFSVQKVHRPGPSPQGQRASEETKEEAEQRQQHTRRSSFSDFIDDQWRSSPRKRSSSRVSVSRLQGHSKGFGSQMPKSKQEEKGTTKRTGANATNKPAALAGVPVAALKKTSKPQVPIRTPSEKGLAPKAKAREKTKHAKTPSAAPKGGRITSDELFADTPITAGTLNREALKRLELLWRSDYPATTQELPNLQPANPEANETIQDFVKADRAARGDLSTLSDSDSAREDLLRLPLPTPVQLERDARTYMRFRIWHLAGNLLQKWREVTHAQRQRLLKPRASADYLDRRVLLEQAMQRWKESYRREKRQAQLEEYHESLQQRATEWRNVHLLAKAFTHWAECGADERRRSKSARRHILRTKYFHAWQEITSEHQNKIRQFALRKFFTKWKGSLVRTLITENQAEGWHRRQIAQQAYSAWFWKFCAEKAPQWRDGILIKRSISCWVSAAKEQHAARYRASMLQRRNSIKNSFHAWLRRAAQSEQKAQEAEAFQRAQIVSRALPQWQTQLRLAAPARQVQASVERRLVSKSFDTWHGKQAMVQQARHVDAFRIARAALTQWNEKLRIKVLQQQRARRLVGSCLYQWVLAERAAHFQRVSENFAMEKSLNAVLGRFREMKSTLQQKEEQFAASSKRKLLSAALAKWREKHQRQKSQAKQAQAIYEPRTSMRVLQRWSALRRYRLELDEKAESAQDYFCGTRAIKSWRAATSTSRKQKLQAAYAAVRVKHKKALARLVLSTWLARTKYTLHLAGEAETFLNDHTWDVAHLAFESWAGALQDVERADATAIVQRKESLLSSALQRWAAQSTLALQQAAQAASFSRSGAEKTSYECLRQLQLKLLEQKNLSAKAVTVRSWTTKRRARMVLKRWAEKTVARKEPPQMEQGGEQVPRRSLFSTSQGFPGIYEPRQRREGRPFTEEARRTVAEWIPPPAAPSHYRPQNDPVADLQIGSLSPLQPYLSTPSKRAARARAMVQSFTPRTEPRMPLLRTVVGGQGVLEESGEEGFAVQKGKQGFATVGRSVAREDRSFIPMATNGPQTPMVRSLFRSRIGGRVIGDQDLARSLRPVLADETDE